MNTILMGAVIILVLTAVGVVTWYFVVKRKYKQYCIEILEEDANGNVYRRYDNGGVFKDKTTGFRLLFIEKAKVGMNPNNIPYISSVSKKGKLTKTVTLRRIGINNYVYVRTELGTLTKWTIGEEDTNNAAQEMAKIRRTYNKEGWLNKLAPYILFIVTILITMIILISLFNKFEVLQSVADKLDQVSEKQLEMTRLMYNMTMGTSQTGVIPIIKPTGT